ncbi:MULTISPECIES: hypothetical protein [unclassified Crossiella]|uniref:hypothetical protein n=1 Tax=unclassified Crossiella TaxID=2620835 RepID=UPI0020004493|nr:MULTISPECIES: hypothetical protein [unclassified Crossiella]MCK2240885.1 hypothetical protein [Crossiella sp. S99.2]MCK2253971.1 hypothetical protein [Crossiella sp. S99.1]
MTAAETEVPQVKLGAIIDFVVSGPGLQTRTVENLRRMYLDEAARPWFYYEPMVNGIKRALASEEPGEVLDSVVHRIDDPAKSAHFQELRGGFLTWLAKARPALVPVGGSVWRGSDGEVGISPHLGLTLGADPRPHAVMLYLKKPELTQAAANIPLWMVERQLAEILPGGRAAILDVRRGKLFRLRANASPKRLDASVAGALANFSTIWQAIA